MNTTAKASVHLERRSTLQNAVAYSTALAILILRRPDTIIDAQFYAEDGRVWFADAYNRGWFAPLLSPYAGYLTVTQRIAGSLSLLVPMALAPLVMNVLATLIQAAPVPLLLSSRSSTLGQHRFRAALALVYILLPNCSEISCNITNCQWPMGVCAFLVVIASVPYSRLARAFDIGVLLLCGLTGPFGAILLPGACYFAWTRKEPWRWVPVGTLIASCAVQAWSVLFMVSPELGFSHSRASGLGMRGATPELLIKILAERIYLSALIGSKPLPMSPSPLLGFLLLCLMILGTAILLLCLLRSSIAMKYFLVVSATVLAASLASPLVPLTPGVSAWQVLASAGGLRYWYFPTLAFAWALIWCAHQPSRILRGTSIAMLAVMCVGIVRDFRHPARQDMQFESYVRAFDAAPPGTNMVIPINPPGWTMTLTRRGISSPTVASPEGNLRMEGSR